MGELNFVCGECRRVYSGTTRHWRCDCGSCFDLRDRPHFDPSSIETEHSTLWRYAPMLPVHENPVTLGEGLTPVVPGHIADIDVVWKLEYVAPTASFKDRGTTVLVSFLKQFGIMDVVEDSSGNAGASLAAYCAKAGIGCRIFVPAHASPNKLTQIEVYGAELCPIDGPRENAARAVQEAATSSYYASHVYNPIGQDGLKTFAFEVWEQLRGETISNLVFPAGHGTLLLGGYAGVTALRHAGLIPELPRLFAVQAENCAPLQGMPEQGLTAVIPKRTLAEGISIKQPVRWKQIWTALRETGGRVVTVGEQEILDAQRTLALQGLYVEPTAAAAPAALPKLKPLLKPGGLTVIPLTGHGLKSADPR